MTSLRWPSADEDYVGLPFLDGGRVHVGDIVRGVDCWGLVAGFLEQAMGLTGLPDYGGTPAVELATVAREIRTAQELPTWLPIDRRLALRGDVVTMTGRDRVEGRMTNVVCHVGVLVDPRRVLHVEAAAASAIVRLDHVSIRNRIVGFYRHRDLA